MKVKFRERAKRRLSASPDVGKAYVKLAALPGERTRKERKVLFYQDEMEQGQWYETVIATVWVREKKTPFKLNGQHTMEALSRCSKAVRIPIVWVEYEVATMEDAADLYCKIDRVEVGRKWNERLRCLLDNTGRSDWPTKQSSFVVAALAFHEAGRDFNANVRITGDDRLALLAKYPQEAAHLLLLLGRAGEATHLHRWPVAAAFLDFMRKDAEQAEAFALQVRDGEGLHRGDPAYVLRERLKGATLQSLHAAKGNLATREDMYCWCVNAWNALRRGEKVHTLKGSVRGQIVAAS